MALKIHVLNQVIIVYNYFHCFTFTQSHVLPKTVDRMQLQPLFLRKLQQVKRRRALLQQQQKALQAQCSVMLLWMHLRKSTLEWRVKGTGVQSFRLAGDWSVILVHTFCPCGFYPAPIRQLAGLPYMMSTLMLSYLMMYSWTQENCKEWTTPFKSGLNIWRNNLQSR